MSISAILLSAGKSERMNFPKAFLKTREGIYFIEKIVQVLNQVDLSEIICVVNEDVKQYYTLNNLEFLRSCKTIVNHYPEKGRFYSVYSGIKEAGKSGFCMLLNVDNPEVDAVLIKRLLNEKDKAELIVPQFNNSSGHPVLINSKVIGDIKNTTNYNTKLNEFLKAYSRYEVEVFKDNIHLNINTNKDYRRYLSFYTS